MSAQLISGINVGAGAMASILTIILIISIYVNDDLSKISNKYFLCTCYSMLGVYAFDSAMYLLRYQGMHPVLFKISVATSGIMPDVFVVFFTFYVISILRTRGYINKGVGFVMILAAGTSCILWMEDVLMGVGWFIRIINIKNYVYTNGYWVVVVIPVLIMIFDVFLVCSFSHQISIRELISWLLYAVLPVMAMPFIHTFEVNIVYHAEAIAMFVVYAFEHNAREKKMVLAEKDLADSRMQIMVSQIQPHFMYNSLNSIYYLIDQNPEEAQEAVSAFSDYLRQNINSLKSDKPVQFKEELNHTEAYLYLEKIRFGDKLKIEKDIQYTDFEIPALSIQPLVENAIKHGLSVKADGGTVKISSRLEDNQIVIEVEDDGVGFKAGEFDDSSKGTHIGIFNVYSRLQNMCSGTLDVNSVPGKGTISKITMPAKKRTVVEQ